DIWKDAMQEGWAPDNLAEKTRSESVEVVRSRLTLDDFWKVYNAAKARKMVWLMRAMELALVTAQRREDIANMEFRAGKESTAWAEDDALCVIQHKTGTKLRIPLELGVGGLTVGGVIKACRDTVVSRWMVHHHKPRTLSKPGDQVWIDTISKGFAKARQHAGVTGEEGKTPPTFHEIRSLSIRLYVEAYGAELAQAIAGHKDAAMTAVYRDVRGAEWLQIKA
ncbi:MAG TPA: tyrosine-type recombinase/integrase, partial [Gallionellaceae bacterium]